MITREEELLLRRAKDAINMITCKGYLSERDLEALKHLAEVPKGAQ